MRPTLALFLCSVVSFGIVLCRQDYAQSEEAALPQLRNKCEDILKKAVAEPLPKDGDERLQRIWVLGRWPLAIVEGRLVELLADADFSVRAEAADALSRLSGKKHRAPILEALNNPGTKVTQTQARKDIIRLRLGEKDAINKVRAWASFQVLEGIAPVKWTCALHPQLKIEKKGRCPICGMQLVHAVGSDSKRLSVEFDRRAAQFNALYALAERKDTQVSETARGILTDDVSARWRMPAAREWARVAPHDALPHLRIFLDASDQSMRLETIMSLSIECPKPLVEDMKKILEASDEDSHERLYSAQALVSAGQEQYRDEIRRIVSGLKEGDDHAHWRFLAISALGECGTRDDFKYLAPHLATSDRVTAASAILKVLGREQE